METEAVSRMTGEAIASLRESVKEKNVLIRKLSVASDNIMNSQHIC